MAGGVNHIPRGDTCKAEFLITKRNYMPRATIYAGTHQYADNTNARIITCTALDFIKALRAQNVEVTILPDDGTPIHYLGA
jgi:hypothetical protein